MKMQSVEIKNATDCKKLNFNFIYPLFVLFLFFICFVNMNGI